MLPAAVIAAATLSMAVAATAFACHGWEKIFESKQKGVHFAGIQAGDDADWVAGGIGIAAAGTGAAHDEQPLPGVAMESFGAGPDGTLYAAGSHGTIWRRVEGAKWQVEHQSRAPGTRGKTRDADMLVGVRLLTLGGRKFLTAFGPSGFPVLVRSDRGSWQAPSDSDEAKALAKLAVDGPESTFPKGCELYQWRWFADDDGLLVCRDGRAFTLLDGKTLPAGKAPKACDIMRNVARRKGTLFVGCGGKGNVYQVDGTKWQLVPALKNVFAVAANDRCVFAVTQRTVLRQCTDDTKDQPRAGTPRAP